MSLLFLGLLLRLFSEVLLVPFTLVPHDEVVSFVHLDSFCIVFWMLDLEFRKEADRELFPAFTSSHPHFLEIAFVAEILSDCNRQI